MNDLQYRRASEIYWQIKSTHIDPHQKPPPVTEPYQPFDHEYEERDEDEKDEDESDGW